jgi:peptide/nickel transport system substrate-binding protein
MAEDLTLEELLDELVDDPVTRRELLRRAGIGAGAAAVAGRLPSVAAADAEATPKRGGRLTVGAGEDTYRLTGPRANIAQYPLNANVFEPLVRMTGNYQLVPVLATRWRLKRPNTWHIELRRGVRFHDGRLFTAEAVKYTYDRIASAGGGTPGFGPDSTKIVDAYTVEITPKFVNDRLIEQIVHPQNSIIAPGTAPDSGGKPVGTGPFSFVRYDRQQQIVVKRFDRYWGKKALLDQITWKFLPDPNARRLALEAGDVDLILDVPREAVADLRRKGYLVQRSQVGAYEAMYCKIGTKGGASLLRGNPAVRRAIGYAIDRDALVRGVYEGLAKNEETMVPARLLGRSARRIHGYTLDRAKARRLLDAAGWRVGPGGIRVKNGARLSLDLIVGFPDAPTHGSVPEFVQDQLRRVGIGVEIVRLPDGPSYTARLDSGHGDLWLEQGNQNDANPVFLPGLLFWSVGIFGDVGYQPLFAPRGRFDTLIVKALAARSFDQVKSITADALHFLIDQDAIVIPLAGIYRIVVMRKKVHGFEVHPSGLQIRYNGVWLG